MSQYLASWRHLFNLNRTEKLSCLNIETRGIGGPIEAERREGEQEIILVCLHDVALKSPLHSTQLGGLCHINPGLVKCHNTSLFAGNSPI